MKRILIITLLIGSMGSLMAQTVLEAYIREGLENNEGLRQQGFALKKSLYALREARSLFFPSVRAGVSYSLSDGGRTIAIPVGDMLNPVYSTLNQLTGSQDFPALSNMEERLNPDNYYDAKLRFALPLIDAELYYNRKIRKEAVQMEELELSIYKRELIQEIKRAYFQFLQANAAVEIYRNGLQLAEEGLRLNRALQRNGKANAATVMRSENEVSKASSSLASAGIGKQNAAAFFNFLLNKPFESEIVCEEQTLPVALPDDRPGEREELLKLDRAYTSLLLHKKLQQSFVVPKLGTFIDVGSQGFDWKFNNKTTYYLFGLSLEWNLSLGGLETYRIKQASMELERIRSQRAQAGEQLRLQTTIARNALFDAEQQYEARQQQLSTVKRYYNDQIKLYREGALLYIEMLDAYQQYIQAQVAASLARYEQYIKQAELERCLPE